MRRLHTSQTSPSLRRNKQVNDRNQLLLTAHTFQFDLAHRFAAAETFLGIKDFQTRQSNFAGPLPGRN
jgi:hypothetical protein